MLMSNFSGELGGLHVSFPDVLSLTLSRNFLFAYGN